MNKGAAWNAVAILVLAALGYVAFGPSLENGFVNYDDPSVIVDNPVIEGPGQGNFRRVFSEVRDNAYLPFYYASFWIDHAIGGKRPSTYHAINLAIHVLDAVLAYFLIRGLLARRRPFASLGAFVAAALFAVHPALTESVAWASGRKDLLSLAFALGSLLLFSANLDSPRGLVSRLAMQLLFAAGMFTKSSILVVPLLAWMILLDAREAGARSAGGARSRNDLLGLSLTSLAATAIHLVIAASQGTVGSGPDMSLGARLAGMIGVLWRYLSHLILPFDLSVQYDVPFDGRLDGRFAAGLALIVVLLATAASFRRRRDALRLGLLWFGVALLPFNNVYPRFSGAMADRYLYLPALGLFLAVAAWVLRAGSGRGVQGRAALALVLAAGLVPLSRAQTRIWKDSETLWRDALTKAPGSALPRLQLGHAIEEAVQRVTDPQSSRARLEEARGLYDAAAAVARSDSERLQSGIRSVAVLVRLGRYEEALARHEVFAQDLAKAGRKLEGADADNMSITCASALAALGRRREALALVQRVPSGSTAAYEAEKTVAVIETLEANQAIELSRDDVERRAAIDSYEKALDRWQELARRRPRDFAVRSEALKALLGAPWRASLPIESSKAAHALVDDFPEQAGAFYLRARVFAEVDRDLAIRDLSTSLGLDPYSESAYLLLASMLRSSGSNRLAMGILDRGLKILPGSVRLREEVAATWLAFGRHHAASGRPDLALGAVSRSLELVPDVVEVLCLRGDLHRELAVQPERTPEQVTGSWEEAQKSYERALVLEPENLKARAGLAQCRRAFGLGRLASLTRITGDKSDPAVQKLKADERARGMEQLLEAVRIAPDPEEFAALRQILLGYSDELARVAEDRLDESSLAEAMLAAERALRFAPENPDRLVLMARVEAAQGRHEEAARALREAIARDSRHLRALFELARIELEDHHYDLAIESADRFIAVAGEAPESEALASIVESARAIRRSAEAGAKAQEKKE